MFMRIRDGRTEEERQRDIPTHLKSFMSVHLIPNRRPSPLIPVGTCPAEEEGAVGQGAWEINMVSTIYPPFSISTDDGDDDDDDERFHSGHLARDYFTNS